MKKYIFAFVFCIALFSSVTAFASTTSSIDASIYQDWLLQSYGDNVGAPIDSERENINISSNNGALQILETDYSFPGVNGMDVNITREYDSSVEDWANYKVTKTRTYENVSVLRTKYTAGNNVYYILFFSEDEIFENEVNGGVYINTSRYLNRGDYLYAGNLYRNLASTETNRTFVTRDTSKLPEQKFLSDYLTLLESSPTSNVYGKNWKLSENKLVRYCRTTNDFGNPLQMFTLFTADGKAYNLEEFYCVSDKIIDYGADFTDTNEYKMITTFLGKHPEDVFITDPRGFTYVRAIQDKYGKIMYFYDDGYQVAEEDKYGNLNTYTHNDDNITINDTMGRQINIYRNERELEKVSVTLDDTEHDLLFYDHSTISVDSYKYNNYYDMTVSKIANGESKEACQNKYVYRSRKRNNQYGRLGYLSEPVYLIESIIYPDGSSRDYSYSRTFYRPADTDDYCEYIYRVSESKNNLVNNNTTSVEECYTYSYKLPDITPGNFTTTKSRSDGNYVEIFTHSSRGQLLRYLYSTPDSVRKPDKAIFNEYNRNREVTNQVNTSTTQMFNADRTDYIDVIKHYEYDDRSNVTKEIYNGRVTTYDYGTEETNPYNLLLSTEYVGANGNKVKILNTLSNDLKYITTSVTYECIENEYVEKDRIIILQDSHGNIISKTVCGDNSQNEITQYDHNYTAFPEYSVHTYVTDVTSADTDEGDASPIYSDDFSQLTHYDKYGRIDYTIDSNTNRVSYEYDMRGNLLEQTNNSTNASTTFIYDFTNNSVTCISPEPEETTIKKFYDINGRTVKIQYYDDEISEYVTLESYTYHPESGLNKDIITLGANNEYITTSYTWTYDGKILSKTTKDSQNNIIAQVQNSYNVNADTGVSLVNDVVPLSYFSIGGNAFANAEKSTEKFEKTQIHYEDGIRVNLNGNYDYVAFDCSFGLQPVDVYVDDVLVCEKFGASFRNDYIRTCLVDTRGATSIRIAINRESNSIYNLRGYTEGQLALMSTTVTTTITGDGTITPVKTETIYNLQGNVLQSRTIDPITNLEIAKSTNTYDLYGDYIISSKDANNISNNALYNTMQNTYDYAGRTILESSYDDASSSYKGVQKTYNKLGRNTTTTDPNGNTSTAIYDQLGRIIKKNIPIDSSNSGVVKYYYDGNGNLIKQATQSNAMGTTTPTFDVVEYEYDSNNNMVKSTQFANGETLPHITQYYYDNSGNLLRMYTGLTSPLIISGLDDVIEGNDNEYSTVKYEYDNLGRVIKFTDALGMFETYTYDYAGNVLTKTDRDGTTITSTYNALGLPLTMTSSMGNKTISYTYDAFGNRLTMTDETGTTTYVYDNLLRLESETTSTGYTKTYTYDDNNNVLSFTLTDSTGSIINASFAYNSMNRMASATNNNITETYTYDNNGNLTHRVNPAVSVLKGYNYANWQARERTVSGGMNIDQMFGYYNFDGTLRR
ncbi:MAG: hypothetical protein PHE51_06690, partial [Eubacteriales bacterium]|nr:hypothetical protein [Eubacteriales bacterium]